METELVTQGIDWQLVAYALALLALAVVLLVLEFFVVSFGLLLVSSIVAAACAIYLAFLVSDAFGWVLTLSAPVIAALVVRWGLERIQTSPLVPQREITSEAGYHHVADRLGVSVGSVGTMVTMARPTGRARFPGGECDVQVRGPALERDAPVVVQSIDGPIIFVSPADPCEGDVERTGT